MNGFWDQMIFDNPLKKYLFVLIAIVIRLTVQTYFFKVCRGPVIPRSCGPG